MSWDLIRASEVFNISVNCINSNRYKSFFYLFFIFYISSHISTFFLLLIQNFIATKGGARELFYNDQQLIFLDNMIKSNSSTENLIVTTYLPMTAYLNQHNIIGNVTSSANVRPRSIKLKSSCQTH